MMQCVARWYEHKEKGLFYRDNTILFYGKEKKVLANVILLNPGSAVPIGQKLTEKMLKDLHFSFYLPKGDYHKFTIDPLMHSLIDLFQSHYDGGVIKIFNLFNLRNSSSNSALKMHDTFTDEPKMHTNTTEIDFCNAPVIIATGDSAMSSPVLKRQLKAYIEAANPASLYRVEKIDNKLFAICKAKPNMDGLIESYHLSYACRCGNKMILHSDFLKEKC